MVFMFTHYLSRIWVAARQCGSLSTADIHCSSCSSPTTMNECKRSYVQTDMVQCSCMVCSISICTTVLCSVVLSQESRSWSRYRMSPPAQ